MAAGGGFIIISFPIFVPNGKLISSSAESQICCLCLDTELFILNNSTK